MPCDSASGKVAGSLWSEALIGPSRQKVPYVLSAECRTTPTIQPRDRTRKDFLNSLVKKPILPPNPAYISLEQAGGYSVCWLLWPGNRDDAEAAQTCHRRCTTEL